MAFFITASNRCPIINGDDMVIIGTFTSKHNKSIALLTKSLSS